MGATCAVKWCACLPAEGSDKCAIHCIDESIKPLTPNVVELDETCEECLGSGRCPCCHGDGEHWDEEDSGCVEHGTCWPCLGDGKCGDCDGRGSIPRLVEIDD